MYNVELSPVDSFSSLSLFQESALGSEHFVATPSSTSSLDRTAPAVDVQHAALQALISSSFDTELTVPSFRSRGNLQPYFPHPSVNHLSPSDRHHVHLSGSPPSHIPRLLDQHDFNASIPNQYVPVIPLTSLSGSASGTNPSYGSPLYQSTQQIPSASNKYLSTHQSTDLGDLTISQQIEFDTICSDYLTMLSPTRMDSTNEAEAISPAPSAVSLPPEDKAAAKAIMEVLEGIFVSVLSKHIPT